MRVPANCYALALTCLLCLCVEGLLVALFWARERNLLAALFYSLFIFGPISGWVGPPLYRYVRRASE